MVRWLLAHGARRDAPGYEGKTPLEVAQASRRRTVVALLRLQ